MIILLFILHLCYFKPQIDRSIEILVIFCHFRGVRANYDLNWPKMEIKLYMLTLSLLPHYYFKSRQKNNFDQFGSKIGLKILVKF